MRGVMEYSVANANSHGWGKQDVNKMDQAW